ncbi:MAG: flagellar hook-basal body complex protein [Sphingobium sp.]|nr:flagellar hook-basal body complex protein [Sphingobium sp.]
MSYYTSLSGLRAAQIDLATTSNNVANAGSFGFKKSRAVFGDVFAAGSGQAANRISGSGVRLNDIQQQFSQGSLESTDKTLDLGLAGEGFFVVRSAPPTNGITFTRNGAFTTNDQRQVIDTLGNVLQLMPVDPGTGQLTSSGASSLFNCTLPSNDGNPIPPSAYTPGSATINAGSGIVSVSFANGNSKPLSPAITIPENNGATPSSAFQTASVGDDGVVTATFVDGSTQQIGSVTIPADDGGTAASELASVAIGQDGLVTATFANGQSKHIGMLALANFNNVEGLRPQGDSHWAASGGSGNPIYGTGGTGSFGTVRSGTLEHANVDITEELVAMIAAQRNFSANAKAIEAANTMTQTINNLRS